MSPSLLKHLRQSMKHLVRGTLGLKYARGWTIFFGALFVLFGMGIGPTACEHLIDWFLRPREDAHRLYSFLWLMFTLCVLVATVLVSYWLDRRFFLEEEGRQRFARSKKAVIMTPSWGIPTNAFLQHLAQLTHDEYLKELSYFRPGASLPQEHPLAEHPRSAPGWLELLGRIVAFHQTNEGEPYLERLDLLLDEDRWNKGEAESIRRAAEQLFAIVGQRDGQVRLHVLRDINDADEVRELTLRVLAEIRDTTAIHLHETAIDITGGTASASVGMTLAASECDVDVEYFSQRRPAPEPGTQSEDFAYLPYYLGKKGVWGPKPIRVYTDTHRRQLADE